MSRKYIDHEETFTVIKVKDNGTLETTIGEVDPFVSCAFLWKDAEKMIGKTYKAKGFFSGTFIPLEGNIIEVENE